MTLSELITRVNYALRGTDDDTPTVGDDDWVYWTSLANRKKDEMYDDPNQDWASAFSTISVGTISVSSAPSFTLDHDSLDTLLRPSDQVYVIDSDSNYTYYDLVKPQERDRTVRQIYLAGRNPQTLYFTNAIVTNEAIVGGTLYLPGYYRPADIDNTDESAVIPVDDPNWLALAVAAEVAFNDITYEDKFADLSGKANVLYHNMARKNRKGTYRHPRTTPYNVQRISGF